MFQRTDNAEIQIKLPGYQTLGVKYAKTNKKKLSRISGHTFYLSL